MSDAKAKISPISTTRTSQASSTVVGEIASVGADGVARVHFPESNGVAVPARSAIAVPLRAGEHLEDQVGRAVLLTFENSDLNLPIILGHVQDRLQPEAVRQEFKLDPGRDRDVVVDGQRLVLDGEQEVLIRCGKSSLLLRRDGKVILRGANLISRSSGPNKIKGSSISLN